MATDIVQSLFGVTPQAYQQAQQDRMDAQALQYARLDPFQQANYAIGRGASGLAGAIGGALGGQDPELQRITMRQQIAGQINPNDPASIEKGIVALQQGGDAEGAFMLQSEYRKMMESGALIAQREAAATASLAQANREREPRAAPTTNDLTNARAIALTVGPEGSPEYNAAFKAEYARLTAPKDAKGPAFGAEAERVSKVKFGKPFADLTSAEAAEVDKDLEARGLGKAKAGAFNVKVELPGVKGAGDLVGLRSTINTTLKPYRDALNGANQAIAVANDVLKTNNFASFALLARSLAKASGETQLSKADINAFGGDPSFVGSIADFASKLAQGTPTADTVKQLKSLAVLLKKKNEDLEKNEIKQLQTAAKVSGLYTEDQIKDVFTLRGETKTESRKTASGISYTVEAPK
jgi:hypothetical protein